MLAITCSAVRTETRRTLVPESRIVSLTDDGAGTITVVVACYDGHLHRLVTGRAAAAAQPAPLPAPVPVAA